MNADPDRSLTLAILVPMLYIGIPTTVIVIALARVREAVKELTAELRSQRQQQWPTR